MDDAKARCLGRRDFLKSTAVVALTTRIVEGQDDGGSTAISCPAAPLFRDPIYDGAADPTLVWNRRERSWWVLYTQRRANVDTQELAWVHGCDIGIASSSDGGNTWLYRGVPRGLEFEWGRNTFWAPAAIWQGGKYHIYLAYIRGVPHNWTGERRIVHYTSKDLFVWTFESALDLTSKRVIDPCVYPLSDGTWRMWFKDEAHGSHIYWAESRDLYHWKPGAAALTDRPQEAPIVFRWRNYYWMLTDTGRGLGVYQSADAQVWVRQQNILTTPGTRPDDESVGHHADVVVDEDNAYIFYFTHPGRGQHIKRVAYQVMPYSAKRSSLQVAKLGLKDGNLQCNRDQAFQLKLKGPWIRY